MFSRLKPHSGPLVRLNMEEPRFRATGHSTQHTHQAESYRGLARAIKDNRRIWAKSLIGLPISGGATGSRSALLSTVMTRDEQKQLDKPQEELAQASHEASARGTEPSEDPLVVSLEERLKELSNRLAR